MDPIIVIYEPEDVKVNSRRFTEETVKGAPASKSNTFAGTIYVSKNSGLSLKKKLRVTIEEID